MLKFDIVPARTAILVIDMTQGYFEPKSRFFLPSALEILPRLNRLLSVCRMKGVSVVYTQPKHQRDGSDRGLLNLLSPTHKGGGWTHEQALAAEEEFAIYSGIAPVGDEPVVGRPRFSAFFASPLDLILRGKGVDTVIVSGVATNTCCHSTARDAHHRDYKVIFLSDGNGARGMPDQGWGAFTAEQVQKYVLTTLAVGWCQVSPVDQIIAELEGK
ncbi:MAG: cysteine hydrolase [Chloroflexi bacterium]|nr:cysteine hydrolase [Chloroflexota bacterium]